MITKKKRRQSTNYAVIVPSVATWMSNTILASDSPNNKDPAIEKFCADAATQFIYTTPEALIEALANGVVLVQLLNSIKPNLVPKYNKSPKSGKPISTAPPVAKLLVSQTQWG